jgi:hypothetical protein
MSNNVFFYCWLVQRVIPVIRCKGGGWGTQESEGNTNKPQLLYVHYFGTMHTQVSDVVNGRSYLKSISWWSIQLRFTLSTTGFSRTYYTLKLSMLITKLFGLLLRKMSYRTATEPCYKHLPLPHQHTAILHYHYFTIPTSYVSAHSGIQTRMLELPGKTSAWSQQGAKEPKEVNHQSHQRDTDVIVAHLIQNEVVLQKTTLYLIKHHPIEAWRCGRTHT